MQTCVFWGKLFGGISPLTFNPFSKIPRTSWVVTSFKKTRAFRRPKQLQIPLAKLVNPQESGPGTLLYWCLTWYFAGILGSPVNHQWLEILMILRVVTYWFYWRFFRMSCWYWGSLDYFTPIYSIYLKSSLTTETSGFWVLCCVLRYHGSKKFKMHVVLPGVI